MAPPPVSAPASPPLAPRYSANGGYAADLPGPGAGSPRTAPALPYGQPPLRPMSRSPEQTYAPPANGRPRTGEPMVLNSHGIY